MIGRNALSFELINQAHWRASHCERAIVGFALVCASRKIPRSPRLAHKTPVMQAIYPIKEMT